jgi:general stress protein 26
VSNSITGVESERVSPLLTGTSEPPADAHGQAESVPTSFATQTTQRRLGEERVTPERVLRELRAHNFAVISTTDEYGAPDSAGVNYGVSAPGPGRELAIYVMTRRHLKKARNIARNPHVSLVVPLPRRILQFVPPATIQLRGRAEIFDWRDPEGTEVFGRFWMGRGILAAYEESTRRGETRICFLRITPDPVVRTYAVGYSAWELRGHIESAAATVRISAARMVPAGKPVATEIGGTNDDSKY